MIAVLHEHETDRVSFSTSFVTFLIVSCDESEKVWAMLSLKLFMLLINLRKSESTSDLSSVSNLKVLLRTAVVISLGVLGS